ncbi:MAG: zf-HC2 domain-containing protein [Deltaproteobacteria bacterium]|nr:zf-HC2 domain-containing protein [Deltaproteobacteria bacterium]
MTTCSHAERLVPLLYDGELDGPLRREVSAHVSGCAVCTRALAALGRGQELLCQAIDEQVEEIDFSSFWGGVAAKLIEPKLPWVVRLQLWWERWWPGWSLSAPAWAVTAALLLIVTALLMSLLHSSGQMASVPQEPEPFALAANDQAQIESLFASATVLLWNEPARNATVIWVSDDSNGGMP